MSAIDTETKPVTDQPTSAFAEIRQEIRDLGLEEYVGRLEMDGYTVVPPELVLAPGMRERLLEGILDWAEQCHGERPDLDTDDTTAFQRSGFGDTMPTILGYSRLFEEMLLNPVVMAFAAWLVGYSACLNYYGPSIKGRGGAELEIHNDAQLLVQTPGPLPPYPVSANCTLALTDFTVENGCTVVIPGSHKSCTYASGRIDQHPDAVPVECPAGSLVVWNGHTWHGALPRQTAGKRVTLLMYFARYWLRPRENWAGHLSDEVLARNPARLRVLTGQSLPFDYHTYEGFLDKAVRGAEHHTTVGKSHLMSLWT